MQKNATQVLVKRAPFYLIMVERYFLRLHMIGWRSVQVEVRVGIST